MRVRVPPSAPVPRLILILTPAIFKFGHVGAPGGPLWAVLPAPFLGCLGRMATPTQVLKILQGVAAAQVKGSDVIDFAGVRTLAAALAAPAVSGGYSLAQFSLVRTMPALRTSTSLAILWPDDFRYPQLSHNHPHATRTPSVATQLRALVLPYLSHNPDAITAAWSTSMRPL